MHTEYDSPDNNNTISQMSVLAADVGFGPYAKEIAYASFSLATAGQIALLVVILMYFRSSETREQNAPWLNMLAVTLFSTIPPYLLIYGSAIWVPEPPSALCVTQASLIIGTAVMPAMTSISLVWDVMVEIRSMPLNESTAKGYQTMLMATPYIVFIAFSVTAAVLSLIYPFKVSRHPDDLACALENVPLNIASQILSVSVLLMALCLEVHTLVTVLKLRRRDMSGDRRPASFNSSKTVRIIVLTCLQALPLIAMGLRTHLDFPRLRVVAVFAEAFLPLGTSITSAPQGWRKHQVFTWLKKRDDNASRAQSTQQSSSLHVQIVVTIEHFADSERKMPSLLAQGLTEHPQDVLSETTEKPSRI
ncbi:hypothetical protein BD311DRAFT_709874 [Dichomitus squalens]|uniref:Fungal pheromone mating factor STE2 GPCR-domain-containing protein n=1 Tax=Dichomitus squalens TaxID=114155 RepID=A0A4Q9Q6C7_9APHY|nr:hypothetical protein BD311DRAFT_709874 [Dichomitus squalens]TBU62164.1 hypothetical protein BD310DRAFT_124789 [Dichomitus squalens]